MAEPDISVIITTYNVERYIERALRSALDQQGITLEVILVDDCSTDNTWNAVSKITDNRIKCFRLDKNSGPSVARNTGIEKASGAWIAVLDGDDAFLPGRLTRCLAHAKTHHADIVVDNLNIHREADGAEFPMFPPAQFSKLTRLDLATFIRGTLTAFSNYTLGYLKPVFSAEFLRKHKLAYDPDIRIGEDYMLLCEALASGAHCAVEQTAGYVYTVRSGSISHRLSLANISRMLEVDAKFLAHYKLDQVSAKAQQNRESYLKKEYAYTLLVDAIKQGSIRDALKAIASRPACVWLLRRPLWVRLHRLLKHC